MDADSDYCYYIRALARYANMPEGACRVSVRALVRKGLVELVRELLDENTGMLAGFGYRLTAAGRKLVGEMNR
jgi:hypothetical protein